MKILIASDIHGDSIKFNIVMDFFLKQKIDQMILLGDIFNGYSELNVDNYDISKMLFNIASKLVIVRGNCDSDYDKKILPVGFCNKYEIEFGDKRIFCQHGHHTFKPTNNCNIYAQGHTHCIRLDEVNGIIHLNPGSVGRARDNSGGSFAVISDDEIMIYDLAYHVLKNKKL